MRSLPVLPAAAGVPLLVITALGTVAAQAPIPLLTAHGNVPAGRFGTSVAAAGDIDRDGFADVVIGAPWAANGTARVLSGANGAVLRELTGNTPWDTFGCSVSCAGDVNDDGWPDLIVGAFLDDAAGANAGSARVFSGFDFSEIRTHYGAVPGAEFGFAVAGAGDVDHDGFDDVIVGAPSEQPGGPFTLAPGSATVFSGFDGSILFKWYGDDDDDRFGAAVAHAGDVNGDGWPDLIVGAPWHDGPFLHAGMAQVFSTNPAHQPNALLYSFDGDGGGYEFGYSVASAGDIDGDLRDDLFVGQPEDKVFGDDAGSAVLFAGATGARLFTFYGDNPFEYFGFSVSAADVDFDGVNDLIVGEPRNDFVPYDDRGAVHVYSGANYASPSNRLFSLFGSTVNARLGESVAFAGDVNNDGFPDFIAGAPWSTTAGGNQSGYATVWCGSPGHGSTSTYGIGCPPGSALTLAYTGTPRLGQPWSVGVGNGPAMPTFGWIVFGFSNGAPWPLSLDVLGLLGCTQYQSADIIATVTMAGGTAALPLTVPPAFAPCGLRLFNQAIALDPGAPYGVRVSNAGAIVLAP